MKICGSCLVFLSIMMFASLAEARTQGIHYQTNVPLCQAIDDAMKAAAYNDNWMVMLGDGQSMTPYFGNGSVVLASRTNYQKLKPGMMVVFREGNELVGHWLVAHEQGGWVTRGVNNSAPDPQLMTEGDYVGVIFGVLNSAGADAQGVAYAQQHNLPRVIGKTR